MGVLGLSSLAGCLGVLGAEPVDSEQDSSGENGTKREDDADSTGQTQVESSPSPTSSDAGDKAGDRTPDSTLTAEPVSGPPTGPDVMPADIHPSYPKRPGTGQHYVPIERVYLGPITSPATNDWNPRIDDPEEGEKLVDVAVHNSTPEDWVVSPPMTRLHIDGLELTVTRDGTFTAEGGLHYHNKCGYFGVNHLYVKEDTATIFLAYGHNPACSDSDLEDGEGYWFGPVSVTGRLEGDFETLRIILLNGNQNLGGSQRTDTMEFEV